MSIGLLWTDVLGLAAGSLVLLTFLMPDMMSLRLTAIASNLAFLAYALAVGLMPIMVLHGLLLPINVLCAVRLARCRTMVVEREHPPHLDRPQPRRQLVVVVRRSPQLRERRTN